MIQTIKDLPRQVKFETYFNSVDVRTIDDRDKL